MYKQEILKYIDKGYAKKLTSEGIANRYQHVWYLPHFAVQTVHKPEKVCTVFDTTA